MKQLVVEKIQLKKLLIISKNFQKTKLIKVTMKKMKKSLGKKKKEKTSKKKFFFVGAKYDEKLSFEIPQYEQLNLQKFESSEQCLNLFF